MKNKGFTLIELLIVITLLGILAVAVLSAINPIEQINRSKDTARQGDSEQLINASDRYYATKGYYPWMGDGEDDLEQVWEEVDTGWMDDDNVEVLEDKLASGGAAEIKSSFVSRISALTPLLRVYNKGTQGDSTYVCFNPSSADFREKAWNRCLEQGGYGTLPGDYPTGGACPATNCSGAATADLATDCYSCLP